MLESFTLVLFFSFLSLPLLAVRAVVLQNKIPSEPPFQGILGKGFLFFLGVSQDLFILAEHLLLFILIKFLLPVPFILSLSLFIGMIFFLHFNVILDGFLFQQTSIRLEASFFSFFDDLKCFWDSAKERGFWIIFPLGGVLLGLNILVFAFYLTPLEHAAFTPELVGMVALLGLPGIFAEIFLSKKILYNTSNVVLQQQLWLIKKLFGICTRKKQLEAFDRSAIKEVFPMQGEKSTYVSKTYPLLKYTHGFEGEEQFEIDLEEGEKPHVIFLFMESFRAKDVGCISGKTSFTPHFDALAKEGILFNNFYSNSIKTSRAVTASLFGIPSDVDSSNASNRIDLPLIGVADLLKQHGYHTSYFHNGTLEFENQLEFFKSHGFQSIHGKESILKNFPEASSTSWGVHDEYLMNFTSNWLINEAPSGPNFTTMFTITNHHPWTSPPGYGNELPKLSLKTAYQRYAQTFQYSDYALNLFIDRLKRSGMSKKIILFILGDHGQPMGEHQKNYSSQKGLYEENVHVPLLILADGRIKNPKVVDAPGSQVDLLPTILDLLGLKGFNHSIGRSLLRTCPEKQVFFHNPYVYGFFGCRRGPHKFIYSRSTGEVELFDIEKDPLEKHNLYKKHPELIKKFTSQVMSYENIFKTVYENKLLVDERKSLITSI